MAGVHLTGKSHYEATRKSKEYGENRTCEFEGCETGLSRYNSSEKCFLHAPKKSGRVRGWKAPK